MSNIKLNKEEFTQLLGKKLSDQRLDDEASFLGAHWNHVENEKWDVEVYPNRPDLLSVEGLSRAYKGFFKLDTGLERYNVGKKEAEIQVDESTEEVRPYIAGAVVKDLELSERVINGLIQLQEKLHQTMGRRRDKIAIGLHDMSNLNPPFEYKAVSPDRVSFTPLEHESELNLGEILDEHKKGREYSWILENEDKYPVIIDSEDNVLSFPPIINNQLTEVDEGTTDIFIDVTGKDREAVENTLNIIVTALAERKGRIKAVEIEGRKLPDLTPKKVSLDPDYFRDVSGLNLSKSEIMDRLKQMKFGASAGKNIQVKVPCYRTDIMHQYDLIEDIVIAHRYSNIEPEMPNIDQEGKKKSIEDISDLVRDIMIGTGAIETLTYIHENEQNLSDNLLKEDSNEFVRIKNPLSKEYSAVRNLLFPSLLSVLNQNKHNSYPQEFFETGDVVEFDQEASKKTNERRKLAYVVSGSEKGFNDVRKILQVLSRDLGLDFELEENEKTFLAGNKSGVIKCQDQKIGIIGELNETVQEKWELEMNTSILEIDLEKIESFR